jgi:hypothetical protein
MSDLRGAVMTFFWVEEPDASLADVAPLRME